MKNFKEFLEENYNNWRAGGIPYYKDGGDIRVCLFISNNPMYGGAAPQIPKGGADPNETPEQAGCREASEETGIPHSVLKKAKSHRLSKSTFHGEVEDYMFHVYAFELDKMHKTRKNAEGEGVWLYLEQALKHMRRDQRKFVEPLIKEKEG